jgi:hypothetical protein
MKTVKTTLSHLLSIRSLVVLAGVTAAWASCPTAARAQTPLPGVYRTNQVLGFQQTVGTSTYAADNLARVRGLVVVVAANRSTIVVGFPNTWYGAVGGTLTPIKGRPGLYYFRGTRTLSTWVSVNVVSVEGILQVGANGRPTALAVSSRAGNNVAAVVNNTGFSSGVSSAYTAVVSLR